MSSTEYTFDLDDTKFVLFDQLDVHTALGALPPFTDFDRDLYVATLEEAFKTARDVIAPTNGPGDRVGCTIDPEGQVRTPPGYVEAFKAMAEGGWTAPRASPELGGAGLPATISAVLTEIFAGANVAFQMYPGLSSGAARVVAELGPEALRHPVAEKMFTGQWSGTMCLTEAGAGSSVGDNRAVARKTDEPGVYTIEGEKIFISGGDHDMTANIVHMVLARTEDAPAGTKGLSLFMVPKFRFGPDLVLGERNGVDALRIEHKMGINGSSTCVMGFGTNGPCRGWIVGNECDGMKIMFRMMNEARLGVALQGLAVGGAAYRYAKSYANERIQSVSLKDAKNSDAKPVAIVQHPDVRRMLMTQKVLVETMRALCYRIAYEFDLSEHHEQASVRERAAGFVDLMMPVAKSMCTDLGFEVAVSAIQVYGGYGYTQEFPVEQLARDSKIQSIYEGTNGIQALDLLGRKMRIGGGALFMGWMKRAQKVLEAGKEAGLETAVQSVQKAISAVGASAMHIANVGKSRDVEGAMVHAVPFLRSFGYTAMAVEAVDQARVAKAKIDAGQGTPYLNGKVRNLEFFIAHILPNSVALAKTIQSGDTSCLDPELFTV